MRWFALASLAGCTFQPGTAATPSGGGGGGGGAVDAARDATPTPTDVPLLTADAPVSGLLQLASAVVPDGDTNLTTESVLDWAHWSYPNQTVTFNRQAGADYISNIAETPSFVVVGATMTFSWTDGTPNGSVSQTGTAVSVMTGTGPSALHFTVAAAPTTRTLRLYVGVKLATAHLDVSLSDNSATPVTDTISTTSIVHEVYTITFRAAGANQKLNIAWTDTNDQNSGSYTGLFSATLQ